MKKLKHSRDVKFLDETSKLIIFHSFIFSLRWRKIINNKFSFELIIYRLWIWFYFIKFTVWDGEIWSITNFELIFYRLELLL